MIHRSCILHACAPDRTGLRVSEISLGGLFSENSPTDGYGSLVRPAACGINLINTHQPRVHRQREDLGQAWAGGLRREFILATKCGRFGRRAGIRGTRPICAGRSRRSPAAADRPDRCLPVPLADVRGRHRGGSVRSTLARARTAQAPDNRLRPGCPTRVIRHRERPADGRIRRGHARSSTCSSSARSARRSRWNRAAPACAVIMPLGQAAGYGLRSRPTARLPQDPAREEGPAGRPRSGRRADSCWMTPPRLRQPQSVSACRPEVSGAQAPATRSTSRRIPASPMPADPPPRPRHRAVRGRGGGPIPWKRPPSRPQPQMRSSSQRLVVTSQEPVRCHAVCP